MRKILLTLLLLGLVALILSVFFFSEDEGVEQAKQDLGVISSSEEQVNETSSPAPETTKPQNTETSLMKVDHISGEQALSFDIIPNSLIESSDALEITGDVELDNVESIQVTFSNITSDFPNDSYTLKQFSQGDDSFLYRANSKFQVFDYGVNEYTFTTNLGTTKVVITRPTEEEKGQDEEIILGDEQDLISLEMPTSSSYGEPIKLGEASFTYSGIKGFEVMRESPQLFSCDNLTNFLSNRVDSWYYWNTCRPIDREKIAHSYNVIYLDGEKYVYQKHYVDPKTGLYGIYDIETGEGVDKDNIAEKNTELKEREFPSVAVVDDLMSDIILANR